MCSDAPTRGACCSMPLGRRETHVDLTVDRTDENLMLCVARGDTNALGSLYDRYSGSVYSLILRMLYEPAVAEELVQETLLRVWRQASAYSPERGTPATWIFGIARNLAIDELRRRGVRPQPSGGDPDAELARIESGDDDPAEQAYVQIRHEVVTNALAQLPPVQRKVLEMAYYSGLSQSEIAHTMGDPLGTVKTRMRLGLQRLKGLLDPIDIGIEAP